MKKNLPNILSMSRIVLAPFFYFFIISNDSDLVAFSSWLFLIAALTDFFDGWLARFLNASSSLGRFMDPLADKILNLLAFLAFTQLEIIPLWMFVIVIGRDLFTTFLRSYGEKKGKPIQTSNSAKWKTFLQMAFIAYILILIYIKNSNIFGFNSQSINGIIYSNYTYISMLFLTIFTIWTMIEYLIINKNLFKSNQ